MREALHPRRVTEASHPNRHRRGRHPDSGGGVVVMMMMVMIPRRLTHALPASAALGGTIPLAHAARVVIITIIVIAADVIAVPAFGTLPHLHASRLLPIALGVVILIVVVVPPLMPTCWDIMSTEP
jgi:hypothetical protein